VTGRGAGLDRAGLSHKVEMVHQALERHRPDPADPLGALAAVGGLEIAAIAGLALGAAARRTPVLLDGLISTAGCLVAAKLCPAAGGWFLAGHLSVEGGHGPMLAELGLEPLLDLGLRLGEGTGAALAVSVLRAAVAVFNEMATFDSAGVSNRG
jgi:nicotinate-nucleotide--dimethylbenzimidazole phosphoribosyltransferase